MLAIETLLGALTGYFTNDIAIRQLFSKNGVVIREREQFTDLVIEVIEEQLIDEDIIVEYRDSPQIVELFEQFVYELITQEIPYVFSDDTLATYDTDYIIKEIVSEHLKNLSLSEVRLNASYAYEHIDQLLAEDIFRDALTVTLNNISHMNLKDIGFDRIINTQIEKIASMNSDEKVQFLEELKNKVLEAIASVRFASNDEKEIYVKDIIAFDAETIVSMFEEAIASKEDVVGIKGFALLEKLLSHDFIDVFIEKRFPDLINTYLPSLIEELYPIIAEDKSTIEKMVIDSIEESNVDGNIVLNAASSYVKRYFSNTENGKDWLEQLYEKYLMSSEKEMMCKRISDFVCKFLCKKIAQWRQLDFTSETVKHDFLERYSQYRGFIVKIIDRYLQKPINSNATHQYVKNAIIDFVFNELKKHVESTKLQEILKRYDEKWSNQSLEDVFFTEEKQQKFLEYGMDWWHQNGLNWISNQDVVNEQTMVDMVERALNHLYAQPLAKLMCKSKHMLPYGRLATILRMQVFNNLRPLLGKLTREQLEAMSHEELRQLALDVMGREMKPLTYLGGGIGALAGVATGAAMQATGVTIDPDQVALLLAARSGVYGSVGYGTNVMAVKGLFWPYKKVMGVQGLISKNQDRVANKVKRVTENYIINDEIWTQEVQRLANRFDDRYAAWIKYGYHHLRQQKDELLQPCMNQWIEAAMNDGARFVFDKNHVTPYIKEVTKRKLLNDISAEDIVRKLDFKKVYFSGLGKMESVEEENWKLAIGLTKLLRKFDDLSLEDRGNALLKRAHFPYERDFYEKIWKFCVPLYKALPEYILDYSDAISKFIDGKMSGNLSFPLKLAYKMAGGYQLIERVVKVFLGKKLPGYLFQKENVFGQCIIDWGMKQNGGRNLYECGIRLTDKEVSWLKQKLLDIPDRRLHEGIMHIIEYMKRLSDEKVENISKMLNKVMRPIIQKGLDSDKLPVVLDALRWDILINQFNPVLEVLSEGAFKNISVETLLSLPKGKILQWANEMLTFTEEEKNNIIGVSYNVCQYVAPVFWNYLGRYGRILLMIVDVPNIAYERINALSSRDLEMMVRGVAQSYFVRVERMGWLGAVVAIPATVISFWLGGF